MNAECEGCGVTAADMPHEDMDVTVEEMSEFMFIREGGRALCVGCAE